jgi:hypothetical protein
MNTQKKKVMESLKVPAREISTNYFMEDKEISKQEDRSFLVSPSVEAEIENVIAETLVSSFQSLKENLAEKENQVRFAVEAKGLELEIPAGLFGTDEREDFNIVKEMAKHAQSLVRSWVKEINAVQVAESEGLTVAPAVKETESTGTRDSGLGIEF